MGTYEKRLIFIVTDNANTGIALHFEDIGLKFAFELGIGNIVNVPLELAIIESSQATPLSAQVTMVIRAIKQTGNTAFIRNDTTKSAHKISSVSIC
jgi:hypothetical protein